MPRILYAVIATLPDDRAADEYIAWLEDGHVDAVIRAGAHSAMIVRLEREAADSDARPRVQTQYVFGTRELFDQYVAHHAPTLREEGLRRFPPERGVSFRRMVGVIY